MSAIPSTIDLVIFQGPGQLGSEQPVTLSLSPGMTTTGIFKLGQTVIYLLCTKLGSVNFDPNCGTNFLSAAATGQISSNQDILLQFQLAKTQILDYLESTQNESTPDSERLSNLILDNFSLTQDTLTMYITLTSIAGSATKVTLPISFVA